MLNSDFNAVLQIQRKMSVRSQLMRIASAWIWRSPLTFTLNLKSQRFVFSFHTRLSCDSKLLKSRKPGFMCPCGKKCRWCAQVLLELTQQADQEKTVLSFSVCQLGAEGKRRSYDLNVTSYLRRVTLDYCDVPGKTWRDCGADMVTDVPEMVSECGHPEAPRILCRQTSIKMSLCSFSTQIYLHKTWSDENITACCSELNKWSNFPTADWWVSNIHYVSVLSVILGPGFHFNVGWLSPHTKKTAWGEPQSHDTELKVMDWV